MQQGSGQFRDFAIPIFIGRKEYKIGQGVYRIAFGRPIGDSREHFRKVENCRKTGVSWGYTGKHDKRKETHRENGKKTHRREKTIRTVILGGTSVKLRRQKLIMSQ